MTTQRVLIALGIVVFIGGMYSLNLRKPDKTLDLLATIDRAKQAKEANDLLTAEREYKRALEIDSTNVVALNNLANVYVLRSSYRAAVQLYEKIGRVDPTYKLADCNRAVALLALGDTLVAMKLLADLAGTTDVGIRNEALKNMRPVLFNIVLSWRKAWERTAVIHNISEYEKFYSKDFSSQTQKLAGKTWDYAKWMEDQRKKALRKNKIEVQIENLEIDIDQYGAKLTFCQLYHSFDDGVRDEGKKELRFKVESEGIKIVSEYWSPQKCSVEGK